MKMKQTYFNCYFTFFSGAPAAGIIQFFNYGKLPYFYGLNFYPLFYGIFPAPQLLENYRFFYGIFFYSVIIITTTMMIKIKEF